MDAESMMQPRIKKTTINPAMITIGGTGREVAHTLILVASPEMVSIRLYIWAQIKRRKMLAKVRPPSMRICQRLLKVNFLLITTKRNPPAAPTAPASVGVKRPPQIPPMTRAINPTTAQGVATALIKEENSNLGGFSLTPPRLGFEPNHRPNAEGKDSRYDKPRKKAGDEKLSNRNFRKNPIDNHEDGGGNQHAQNGASGDDAEAEFPVVLEALHLREGDLGKNGCRRDRDTGDGGEDGIGQNRGDPDSASNPPEEVLGRIEKLLRGSREGREKTHENEKRNDGKNVIHDGAIGSGLEDVDGDRGFSGNGPDSQDADRG